jgi:hypothetical protein
MNTFVEKITKALEKTSEVEVSPSKSDLKNKEIKMFYSFYKTVKIVKQAEIKTYYHALVEYQTGEKTVFSRFVSISDLLESLLAVMYETGITSYS